MRLSSVSAAAAAALGLMLSACGEPAADTAPAAPAAAPADTAPPVMPADAPPQEEIPALEPEAMATAGAEIPCRDAVGAQAAGRLVERCITVSPATRPPCNAANPCELILDEINRSCALFPEGEQPASCAG